MRESASTVLLADELKRLTGWGVEPARLATKPVLSELAGADLSLSRVTAGCIVLRYLQEAVRAFDSPQEFLGRQYDAHTLRRAFSLELGLEQANRSHPARVYRVMQMLGVDYSYDQWRKHHRYERGLLTVLAEDMMSRHLSQQKESVAS